MPLHQTIKNQIQEAMRAHDEVRLRVVRGLVSACTNELVSLKRKTHDHLTDEEVLAVIRRAVKQRKDSIEQFIKGAREDLVAMEREELVVLEAYLPAQMSREDVMTIARAKMHELHVTDKSGAGKFVGALMRELKSKADGDVVKSVVDELLA